MTQNEARQMVLELIRDHDIKDEVLVGLFLGRVKREVWDRNGGIDLKLEERISLDFVADFQIVGRACLMKHSHSFWFHNNLRNN